jgi:methanogenic corrinoid protein MtbC1
MNEAAFKFSQALKASDRIGAQQLFAALPSNRSPLENLEQVVIPALTHIGREWEAGDVALAQIYMAGRICEELVDSVLPPVDPRRRTQPPQAIAVLHDYHTLGKNIVYSMLRASGYELLDYGRQGVEELADRVVEDGIQILLISVLMLPSALKITELRRALEERGHVVKLIVGGAPFIFDDHLWREVGADAVGLNAAEAQALVDGYVRELS